MSCIAAFPQKGFLEVPFSFNEKKESGIHTVQVDGKTIVDAIV